MRRRKFRRMAFAGALYHSILRRKYAMGLFNLFYVYGADVTLFGHIQQNHFAHMRISVD